MKLSWILVILLLAAVAIFSVENAGAITIHFLTWEITMSAALVIQVAALSGAIVGLLVGAFSGRRRRAAPAAVSAQPPSHPGPESRPGFPPPPRTESRPPTQPGEPTPEREQNFND